MYALVYRPEGTYRATADAPLALPRYGCRVAGSGARTSRAAKAQAATATAQASSVVEANGEEYRMGSCLSWVSRVAAVLAALVADAAPSAGRSGIDSASLRPA